MCQKKLYKRKFSFSAFVRESQAVRQILRKPNKPPRNLRAVHRLCLQIFWPNGNMPDPFADGCVGCIYDDRGNRWNAHLSDSGGVFVAGDDVHFDARHFVRAQDGISAGWFFQMKTQAISLRFYIYSICFEEHLLSGAGLRSDPGRGTRMPRRSDIQGCIPCRCCGPHTFPSRD